MVTFSMGLIVFSYTIVTCKTLYEMTKPNQTSTSKTMLKRSIFLNMASFVEVDVGQEAVLECRVDNMVSKYLVSLIEIKYCHNPRVVLIIKDPHLHVDFLN